MQRSVRVARVALLIRIHGWSLSGIVPCILQQSGLCDQKCGFLPFDRIARVHGCERLQNLTSLVDHFMLHFALSTSPRQFQDTAELYLGLLAHQLLDAASDEVFGLPIEQGPYVGGDEQEHSRCRHLRPQLVIANAARRTHDGFAEGVNRTLTADQNDALATLSLFRVQ